MDNTVFLQLTGQLYGYSGGAIIKILISRSDRRSLANRMSTLVDE